ncbi:hypothetical protein L209DRAFT_610675 [Thermothelomyces heterothallicus CBS 203.75]
MWSDESKRSLKKASYSSRGPRSSCIRSILGTSFTRRNRLFRTLSSDSQRLITKHSSGNRAESRKRTIRAAAPHLDRLASAPINWSQAADSRGLLPGASRKSIVSC